MIMNTFSFVLFGIFGTFIVSANGQGVFCDPFTCVEHAQCVDGQCVCGDGYRGYGRFLCVPNDWCACSAYGDPYILQFNQGQTHTVLPCQFNLATLNTASGCNIQVELVTYHRPNQTFPLRAFTNLLKVKVARDNTLLEFSLGFAGLTPTQPVGTIDPSLPDSIPGNDVTVVRSTYDTYIRATLPECDDTIITFDPALLGAAVGTPSTSSFPNPGLCGSCNGHAMDDNPFLKIPDVTPEEASLALSLRQLTNEQSTAETENCAALSLNTSSTTCSDDTTLVKAVRCCGVLYNSDFARCLVSEANIARQALLRIIKECVFYYCAENRKNVAAVYVPVMASFGCEAPKDYVCP